MKKQWEIPKINQLNLTATKEGTEPTVNHDCTTYDDNGKWWAGGVSSNK